MNYCKNLVIGIAGPTGVGKTELALRLAESMNGELVSCDSVQVYKYLTIGSNKFHPTPDQPIQHLVDIIEPTEEFTAGDFFQKCVSCIHDVLKREKTPIVVGGTGFYFDWLMNGRPKSPSVDPGVINRLTKLVRQDNSWSDSLNRLRTVDPEYAGSLLANDYYRLIKAIGFFEQFGRPLSSCGRERSFDGSLEWRCIYLTMDREKLYRSIDMRCEEMVRKGLLTETKTLLEKKLLIKNSAAGRSIGYKESIDYLDQSSINTHDKFGIFLETFMSATRQYARKQETWFSNKFSCSQFIWIEKESIDFADILEYVQSGYPNLWTKKSVMVKDKHRGAEESVDRSRKMRLYRPQFTVFNNPSEVEKTLREIEIKIT